MSQTPFEKAANCCWKLPAKEERIVVSTWQKFMFSAFCTPLWVQWELHWHRALCCLPPELQWPKNCRELKLLVWKKLLHCNARIRRCSLCDFWPFLNFVQLRRFSSQQGMSRRDRSGLLWKHANCRYFLGQREASAWLCSGIPMLYHRGPIVLNLSSAVLLIYCKISCISQCNRNRQMFLPSTFI